MAGRVGRLVVAAALVACVVPASRALVAPVLADSSTVSASRTLGVQGATPPAQWQTLARLGRSKGSAVSCPSSTVCWSLGGGELLSSTDGGATWAAHTSLVPDSVDVLDAIDCPTVDVCFATGRLEDQSPVAVVLRPGGVTHTAVPIVDRLSSIACPTAGRCMTAHGGPVAVTTDGGRTWVRRSPALPSASYLVSCVRSSWTCWAFGGTSGASVARSDDFGVSWTQQGVAPGVSVTDIDCPSTLICTATGYDATSPVVATTVDGGATWTAQALSAEAGRLHSVSCPSTDLCWAFGADTEGLIGFVSTDTGRTWTPQDLPTTVQPRAAAVSCPTATSCAVVADGGIGLHTVDAGGHWRPAHVPVALGLVGLLSCPARDWCVGTAGNELGEHESLTSPDGGLTWTRHPIPGHDSLIDDLDCATRTQCQAWAHVFLPSASRYRGQSLASTDGGISWALHRGPDVAPLSRARLACLDGATCLVAGTGRRGPLVRSTVDGGQTWQSRPPPAGAVSLGDVGCGPTSCVVLGHLHVPGGEMAVAWSTDDLGATYAQTTLPDPVGSYTSVDCAGTFCVAVGYGADRTGRAATWRVGDTSWVAGQLPSTQLLLEEVDCDRSGSCAAPAIDSCETGSGPSVMGTTDRGRTWTSKAIPPSGTCFPYDVACPPRRATCIASDVSVTGLPRIITGEP